MTCSFLVCTFCANNRREAAALPLCLPLTPSLRHKKLPKIVDFGYRGDKGAARRPRRRSSLYLPGRQRHSPVEEDVSSSHLLAREIYEDAHLLLPQPLRHHLQALRRMWKANPILLQMICPRCLGRFFPDTRVKGLPERQHFGAENGCTAFFIGFSVGDDR